MKHLLSVTMLGLLLMACDQEQKTAKATGVFEATELIVSAESTGKILQLNVHEGQSVLAGESMGQIDTLDLSLKKMQLSASQLSLESGKPDVQTEMKATEREIEKLELEKERTARLLEAEVATQKQMDDIEAQLDVLNARLAAQKRNLNASTKAIDAQSDAIMAQIDQLNNQIQKSGIVSPIDATVLVKYVEAGEFVGLGKPLCKLGDLENMVLKAYISAEQLPELKIGQEVEVVAELGATDNRSFIGTISWISSKAEFTPKTIQTQDERANLVYAIKIRVKNDGILKIGMYAGVNWE